MSKSNTKAQSFADLVQRASGYNGEVLASNLITQYMPPEAKEACLKAYNAHVETHQRCAEFEERAAAACLLMDRMDLHHEIYELLKRPSPPV